MSVKAVLFDMDGVLLDSEPLHDKINEDIYAALGINIDKSTVNEFIGRVSSERWTTLKERYSLKPSVDELNDWQWRDLVAALPDSGVGPSAGLDILLGFLREEKIRATIASSSRRAFVEAVIDHLELRDHMSGYTCGEESARCKPAPDIFLLAARKLGVDPRECLVIEDSCAGVRAAKAAGMYTVGYINPTSEGQDLSEADVTVDKLQDVCRILSELNGK